MRERCIGETLTEYKCNMNMARCKANTYETEQQQIRGERKAVFRNED